MRAAAFLALLLLAGCAGSETADSGAPATTTPTNSGETMATGPDEETLRRIRDVLQRAGSLFQQTRFDEALEAASSAIEIAPAHEPTYEVLSNWYTQLDRHDLAVTAFQRFVDAGPSGLRFMARHQALSGDHSSALETLDRCVEASPRHGGCRSERSMLRLPAGDFEGAVEDLRVAFEVAPDSKTAARFVETLRVTGSYDEAREVVRSGLAADPVSVDLLIAQAWLLSRERRDDEAEESLRRALDLAPKSHQALRLLAGLVLRRGDEEQGRFLLARADLYRDYQTTLRALMGQLAATRDPRAALMIAELELTVGEYNKAQQWVDRARAGGADAGRVAAAQAWISFAVGAVAQGDAELAKLANDDSGRTALVRAVRAFRIGQHDEATSWLRRAAERGPNERSFLRRVADLHVAIGDQEAADEILARAATAGFP